MARAPRKTPEFKRPSTRATTPPPAAVRVDFMRPELTERLGQYNQIRDCIAGDLAVKARQTVYLPMPQADDRSPANVLRYKDYAQRAVFYNVTQRTLAGLIGQVFLVDPVIEVPQLLEAVVKDANGNGVSLVQLAQSCEEYVLGYGRAGLLTDYPKTDGVVTRQQQLDGSHRPTINLYQPDQIINWRTITRGGEILLSLVVLRERHETYDDGFAIEYEDQYKVLRLVNNVYVQEIWRGKAGAYAPVAKLTTTPRDAKGATLNEIPFTFVGAVDNSPIVDAPPLYALSVLNIAHYRNSADYEESLFMAGQATPVLSGLDERWVNTVLGGVVRLGSRAAISLPPGASAELLQMEANGAIFEAMEHKERQMVSLGAKLVEQKTVQRTATEADLDAAGEDSILTTITKNVSAAFKFALEWAAIFQGTTTVAKDANKAEGENGGIEFELNTEFDISNLSAEDITKAIDAWMKEAIDWEEMRRVLHKAGLASKLDKDAMLSIRKQRMDDGDTGTDVDGNPLPKPGGNVPGDVNAE